MAYFITASASASVVQTTFDTTGSIVTSSLFTPNDPINVDNIVYVQKGSSKFPNLSRPVFKHSLSFLYNGQSISWLYDTTSSRDSDYNLIKTLNTNYAGGGSSPGGKTNSIQFNGGGVFDGSGNFVFISATNTAELTGSLIIQQGVSGNGLTVTGSSLLSGSAIINDITYPTTDGDNGDIIYTDGAGVLTFDKTKVFAPVKNVSGGTLYKGTPVHASSSVGNANEVIAASASVASTMPATFVLAQDLDDEEEGLGIVTGFINGVNTTGFNEGDVVYVGENGGYTNVKPSGSNLIQNLGIVTKVAVNGSGYIYGAGRSNDTPNLLHNQIFFGSGSNQQYTIHISGALDSTVINNITASGVISGDGSGLTNIQRPLSLSISSNITASNSNAGYFFEVGAVTCSIQANATVACNVGSEFEFFQTASGNFIFVTGSGVTLRSKDGNTKLTGLYSGATLKKIRTDEWVLVGDLTA